MAWVDDRIWCHPKLSDLSDRAFRVWIQGISYSAGMSTGGVLTPAQQRLVGSTPKVRQSLFDARVWDELAGGAVGIHDWDEHNGKRDARRAADRERKRLLRGGQSAGQSAGRSSGQSAGASTGTAHVDGSEGSEGSDKGLSTVSREQGKKALEIINTNLRGAA